MTKLSVSWTKRSNHEDGPFQALWGVLCWVAALGAVAVATAILWR
jgi:hypothetical protein